MRKRWPIARVRIAILGRCRVKEQGLIVVALTLALVIFCADSPAATRDERVAEIRDTLLALTVAESPQARIELVQMLLTLDRLGLSHDELVDLYMDLLDYYIGEATGEILFEKITLLEYGILPFLIQKTYMPLDCEEKYASRCWDSVKERNSHIVHLIECIKNGLVFYVGGIDTMDAITERRMGTIRIFIEDHRTKKGALPQDLVALRDWTWTEYGYPLKIVNPWGYPLKYLRRTKHEYTLEAGPTNRFVFGSPTDQPKEILSMRFKDHTEVLLVAPGRKVELARIASTSYVEPNPSWSPDCTKVALLIVTRNRQERAYRDRLFILDVSEFPRKPKVMFDDQRNDITDYRLANDHVLYKLAREDEYRRYDFEKK